MLLVHWIKENVPLYLVHFQSTIVCEAKILKRGRTIEVVLEF